MARQTTIRQTAGVAHKAVDLNVWSEAAMWVAENIERKDAVRAEAPSIIAWNWLLNLRSGNREERDRKVEEFFNEIGKKQALKAMDQEQEKEKFKDDGRVIEETLAELAKRAEQ